MGKNPITGAALAQNPASPAWRSTDLFAFYPTGFSSGVASGDPLPGQIIIWTRFQPAGGSNCWMCRAKLSNPPAVAAQAT